MTRNEVTDFVTRTSVDELRKLSEGLDLLNCGSLDGFTEEQIDLLVSLRDHERWFRQIADLRIRKHQLESERQDRVRRNVPPGRWG